VRTVSRPQTRSAPSSSRSAASSPSSASRPWGPPKAVQQKASPLSSLRAAVVLAAVGAGVWVLYGDPQGGSSQVVKVNSASQQRLPSSAQEQVALLIQLNPVGGMARVSVNGKSLGENGGAMMIPTEGPIVAMVPQTGTFKVSVEANGFKPIELESAVDPASLGVGAYGRELRVSMVLEPEVYGLLKYRSPIANASLRVEVGGQNWLYKSSLSGGTEVVKLPPGNYRLEFFSSSLNLSQIVPDVRIEAGGSVEQDVNLRK
jgi:hypothetical protein